MQVNNNLPIKQETGVVSGTTGLSNGTNWEEEPFMETDISAAVELITEIMQNLNDCKVGLEQCKYKGFKDFTKDIQINWRKARVKNEETQPVSQAMGQDYQIQEIQQLTDTINHLIYALQRCEKQVRQKQFKTHKILFTSMITIIRDLKMSMVPNSGIFWVIEIIEHEAWRIIENRKIKIKLARQTFMEEQQIQQQQQMQQQQNQILNPEIQQKKRGGRGKRVTAPMQDPNQNIMQNMKMDQSQAIPTQPTHALVDESKTVLTYAAYMASDEKKSYEYVYNYEGMDEKMIAQRKRRIELKKMFEDMLLAESQKTQQQEMQPIQPVQQIQQIQQHQQFQQPMQPIQSIQPMMQMPTGMQQMGIPQQPMMPQQMDQQIMQQQPNIINHSAQLENNESIASKTTIACSSDGVKPTTAPQMMNNSNSYQNQSNDFSSQQAMSDQKSNNTFNNNEQKSPEQQQPKPQPSSMFMAPPVGALDDDDENEQQPPDYPQSFKNLVSSTNKYLLLFRKFLHDQSNLPAIQSDPFTSENQQIQNLSSTACQRLSLILNGQGFKCNDCCTVLPDNQQSMQDHRAYYKCGDQQALMDMQASNNYRSPYRFFKLESTKAYICPFGSGFTTQCSKAIRKHLVNKYTDQQLQPWGYSRNLLYREYLMLLEKQDDGGMGEQSLVGKKRMHSEVNIGDDEDDAFIM